MASPSTFRPQVSGKAWQRLIREEREKHGLPPGLSADDLRLKAAIVRPVTYHFARHIIERYEWLGTMAGSRWHWGIFFGDFCGGVVCYAFGVAGQHTGGREKLGLRQGEVAFLMRGACVHWAPNGSASKLISISLRLLRKEGVKLVWTWSDEDAGEIGTVYQATNWLYVGKGASVIECVAPNGRIYNQKIVFDHRRKTGQLRTVSWNEQLEALRAAGWTIQDSRPKHRYVYVLGDEKRLRALLRPMVRPYPKRRAAEA